MVRCHRQGKLRRGSHSWRVVFRVRKASIVFQKGPTPRAVITKAVVKVTRKDSCKNSIVVNMDGGDAEKIQKTR